MCESTRFINVCPVFLATPLAGDKELGQAAEEIVVKPWFTGTRLGGDYWRREAREIMVAAW